MPAGVAARQPATPIGAWYGSATATALVREEQRQLAPLVTRFRGVRGLFLRPHPVLPCVLAGHLLQRIVALARTDACWIGDLRTPLDTLALQRDAVDLIVALHTVADAPSRIDLLREYERVLSAEGVLLVVELNPWSPFRLRWSRAGVRAMPSGVCASLLRDAGFDVGSRYGVGPVWRAQERETLAPLGRYFPANAVRGGYALLARKRVAAPIAPRARAAVRLRQGVVSG